MLRVLSVSIPFSDIGLTLNGVTYTNNSIVTRTDIGIDAASLNCTTTNTVCCDSRNVETQWYFPNGSPVRNPIDFELSGGMVSPEDLPYRRTRTPPPDASVQLHRNPQGTATGIFRCDILDASGVLQSMFVGIYDSGTLTGESCIYSI